MFNVLDFSKNILNRCEKEKVDKINSITKIIERMNLDQESIITCYLFFPSIENKITKEEENQISLEILTMLNSLKKLSDLKFTNKEEEAENIRKMFFAITKDVRIILIKLAFILDDMHNLNKLSEFERLSYSKLVLELYSPLAARLGLSSIKSELEDIAFKNLKPDVYKQIELDLEERFEKNKESVEKLKLKVQEFINELNIKGKVTGRKKHIYSIYKKIVGKTGSIDKIYDLVAVRAILEKTEDCYALLGKINGSLVPLQNRFKDYIAIPKSNGYQSLHTTVLFENVPVEIQIRTEEMHRAAEYGIAAHWMYKEHRTKMDSLDKKLGWIRELMENTENFSSQDFIDSLKVDIYDGEIFVQTPKGKVLHLPDKAIPIDFAYMIHSDIGNKCVGAKINGKMATLTTQLNNGDIVEIITSSQSKGPSLDWLKIVKTVEARNKIKAFFKKEMKEDNIKNGKTILEQTCKNNGYTLSKLLDNGGEEILLEKYYLNDLEEIFATIGYGSLSCNTIFHILLNNYKRNNNLFTEKLGQEKQINYTINENAIKVEGSNNLMVNFAKCCSPIPGDEIIGFISQGRGIIVHRKDCSNVKGFLKERLIKVTWIKNVNNNFMCKLKILAKNTPNIIPVIAAKLNDFKVNLKSLNTDVNSNNEINISLQVLVKKQEEITYLINKLKNVDDIIDIYRINN